MSTPKEIVIDGVVYRPSEPETSKQHDLPFVIIRTNNAGVHAGYLQSSMPDGDVVLLDSRRIWYWKGAASLSEIAVYGCKESERKDCKFGAKLETLKLRYSDTCEEIHCQPAGRKMIEDQPEWIA